MRRRSRIIDGRRIDEGIAIRRKWGRKLAQEASEGDVGE
jgi:hypothetical protein